MRSPYVSWAAAVLAAVVVVVGLGRSDATTHSPGVQGSARAVHCPRHALRLPAVAVARAAEQALDEVALDYQGVDTRHARVQASDRTAFAGARGSEVRRQCGAKAARRTVVVQLLFPRMLPSASLSQGVVFVARFPRGYRIWEVAH
jgi:hypothetical protein